MGAGLLAKAIWLALEILQVYISISAVTATCGFALTASHLFQTPVCRPSKKVTQKAAPDVRPLAKARCTFAPAFIRGASPSGWLRWPLHAMSMTASCGAARQSPDERLHSASRRGGWIKSQIKIKSAAS